MNNVLNMKIQKHITVAVMGIAVCFGMLALPGLTHAQSFNSASIERGDRVMVRENLSVRVSPGGELLTVLAPESEGTTVLGSAMSGGYTWWLSVYDDGVVGWSVSDWLVATGESDPNIIFTSSDSDDSCQTAFGAFGVGTILSNLAIGVAPVELEGHKFKCQSTDNGPHWVIFEVVEDPVAEVVELGTPGSCLIAGVNYANGSKLASITIGGTTLGLPGAQFVCVNGVVDVQPIPERVDIVLEDINNIYIVRSGNTAKVTVYLASGKILSTSVPNNDLINRTVSFLVDDHNLDISVFADETALYQFVEIVTTIVVDTTVDEPVPSPSADIDDTDDISAEVIVEEEEEEETLNNGRDAEAVPGEPVIEEISVEPEVIEEGGDDQDETETEEVLPDPEPEPEVLDNGRG